MTTAQGTHNDAAQEEYDKQQIEHALQWALEYLLNKGENPPPDILSYLTYGEPLRIVNSLIDALQNNGKSGAKTSFKALCKEHKWLAVLRAKALPPQSGEAEPQPEEAHTQRRIRFRPDSEFENRPPREWLIPNTLPKGAVAMVFGPPGCGKSFLVIAWALCLAFGIQWLGKSVLKGTVAYIAGEGAFGLGARMKAWKTHHKLKGDSGVKWFDATLMLQEAAHLAELMTALEEDFTDSPPVLVVIDTLSRCSGGADENSNTEMAKIVASADAIQQKFGCTVLIVHHAGKDAQKGPRGASALIGNMETIIEVAPTDEGCKVICYKQKDAATFETIPLKLQTVQYGEWEDDNSAVLILGNESAALAMRPSEKTMYAALLGKELTHTEWKQAGIDAKLSESSAKSAITSLVKAGRVQKDELRKVYFCTAESEETND